MGATGGDDGGDEEAEGFANPGEGGRRAKGGEVGPDKGYESEVALIAARAVVFGFLMARDMWMAEEERAEAGAWVSTLQRYSPSYSMRYSHYIE